MSRADPVFICSYCGNGFLRYPGDYDPFPRWGWTEDAKSGGACGGPIIKASRAMQIRNLDRLEINDAETDRKAR
jgi:hypothetical protein